MRRWGIGVAVLAGAFAVGGCGLLPPQSMSDTKTLDQQVTAIRFDGRAGSVQVQGKTGQTKATVERTIKYRDGTSPKQDTYRVDGSVLVLTGDCGEDCSVDYDVTVPAGVAVSGQTTAGDIELHGVGAVDVTTTAGGVDLADVRGTVKAHTTNGEITGSGLRGGGVQVETTNGGIDLTMAEAADVTARTSNGGIKLAVPSGSYRVSTNNHTGRQKIGVAEDPNGKYRLDLNTDNGSIDVTQA